MEGKVTHAVLVPCVRRGDIVPDAVIRKSQTLTKWTNKLDRILNVFMKIYVTYSLRQVLQLLQSWLSIEILKSIVHLNIWSALTHVFVNLASWRIVYSAKPKSEIESRPTNKAVVLWSDINKEEFLKRLRPSSKLKPVTVKSRWCELREKIINEHQQCFVLEVLVPIISYQSPLDLYPSFHTCLVEMHLCFKPFPQYSFNTQYNKCESIQLVIDRDEDITKEKLKNLEPSDSSETKSNLCFVKTSKGHATLVQWQTDITVKPCDIRSRLNDVVDIKDAISRAVANTTVTQNVENSESERTTLKHSLEKAKKKRSRDGRVVQSEDDNLDVISQLTNCPVTEHVKPQTNLTAFMLPKEPIAVYRNGYDTRLESDGHLGTSRTIVSEQTSEIVEPQQTTETSRIPTGASTTVSSDLTTIDSVLKEMANGTEIGPKISMKFELLRLCTLRNFPKNNKPYIIRLAKAGFYYAADDDEVICFSCGIRKRNWTANCDPMATHKRLSPHCSFLIRNAEVNFPVPSAVEGEGRDKFANLRELLNDPGPDIGNDVPASTMTNAAASDNLTVYDTDPKHPHYAVKQVRLNSYVGWPADSPQTPEVLADAGFYFAGMGDCVRCFHCGTGLRHWAADDNPWIEHGRWTLENPCHYLISTKGEEFFSLIRMAVEITNNQSTGENSEQSEGASGNTHGKGVSGKKSNTKQGSNKKGGSKHSKKQKGKPQTEKMQLKEENERLRKQTLCKVCEERDVCVVFLPCGHLVTCAECAPSLSICSTCQMPVKGTVKTYMS